MNAEFNDMVVRHWEIPLTSLLLERKDSARVSFEGVFIIMHY